MFKTLTQEGQDALATLQEMLVSVEVLAPHIKVLLTLDTDA